jgi:hypothetical protein
MLLLLLLLEHTWKQTFFFKKGIIIISPHESLSLSLKSTPNACIPTKQKTILKNEPICNAGMDIQITTSFKNKKKTIQAKTKQKENKTKTRIQ